MYQEYDKSFFTVYTDASDNAIGGVEGQAQKHLDGEKVIPYWSRQLHKAERQYSTVDYNIEGVPCMRYIYVYYFSIQYMSEYIHCI